MTPSPAPYPSVNGTQTITPPPSVNPIDALASSYDVDDSPPPVPVPPQAPAQTAQPSAPAATPPAGRPAATPAPSTESASKHPAWLLAKAGDFGMHPILVENLSTENLTRYVMDTMATQLANRAEDSRQAAVQNPAPAGLNPPEVAAAATAAQTVQAPPQEPAFDWGKHQAFDALGNAVPGQTQQYTDEMVNPAIAHWIKELDKRTKKIDKLESFIQTMSQQAVRSRESQIESEFDSSFSQYPELFGRGSAADVKGSREFMERRRAVFGSVRGMFRAMPPELAGKMTIQQAVAAMTKSLFDKDPPSSPSNPPAPGKDFTNGTLAVPTQRQPSEKPLGEDRAREAARQWFHDHKDSASEGGTTTLDEFP